MALDRIPLYNRETGRSEDEQVFERAFMDFAYGTRLGRALTALIFKRHAFSRWYGRRMDLPWSRDRIRPFAARYGIDLSELVEGIDDFRTFNEFFARKVRPDARPVDGSPSALIAPCDGRLLALPIRGGAVVPVKGRAWTLERLTRDPALVASMEGGTALIYRLAPVDLHRFIHLDDGRQGPVRALHGPLHSVSPFALWEGVDALAENERTLCVLDTAHLGRVVWVEVGALAVGRIVLHQRGEAEVRRGEEKGYFLFGGSSIVVLLGPGAAEVDEDIRRASAAGVESLVRQGSRVGSACGARGRA